jgi:hypothetical protein
VLSGYFVCDFMHKKSGCEQSKKQHDKQWLDIEKLKSQHGEANA